MDSSITGSERAGARVCVRRLVHYCDNNFAWQDPYRNSKAGSHPVEIVRVLAHQHDFRHDCVVRPLHAKDLGQLLQILSRGFADGEDGVAEPTHAQATELLVEEFDA